MVKNQRNKIISLFSQKAIISSDDIGRVILTQATTLQNKSFHHIASSRVTFDDFEILLVASFHHRVNVHPLS